MLRALLASSLLVAACAPVEQVNSPSISPARYTCSVAEVRDAVAASLRIRHWYMRWETDHAGVSSWRDFYSDGRGSRPKWYRTRHGVVARNNYAGNDRKTYDSKVVRLRYRVRIAGPPDRLGFVLEADLRQKKQNRLARIRHEHLPAWIPQRTALIRRAIHDRLASCAVR